MSSEKEFKTGVKPYPDTVNAEMLLNEMFKLIKQHLVVDDHKAIAMALWAMGTYLYDCFRIYPRLTISSPEKGCGKTTALEIMLCLVSKGLTCSNITPAAMFRVIEKYGCTLALDECDTFLPNNDDLRGIINSGHNKASAYVVRVDNGNVDTREFCTWAPMLLALIGTPPDTIEDRSILVVLRRKTNQEKVSRIPGNIFEKARIIREKCQRWAKDNTSKLYEASPSLPDTGFDRLEDNWRSLIAIADNISERFGQIARRSMELFAEEKRHNQPQSEGTLLLEDIREVLKSKSSSTETITSKELVFALNQLEDSPWTEYSNGRGLSTHKLANILSTYSIKPIKIRQLNNIRGYCVKALNDAFARYLKPPE